jgi:hypothetical protein
MEVVAKRIESAKAQAVRQRNYRRARDRALIRLSTDYPDLYKKYLKEEYEKDIQTGKRWTDITGAISDSGSGHTNGYSKDRTAQEGASEGNNGGEA